MAGLHNDLAEKGTYILCLRLNATKDIVVGRLGEIRFQKGFYYYVGSAFGNGGLKARLTHHVKQSRRPRWHIDYFKNDATLTDIIVCPSPIHLEHKWADKLSDINDIQPAIIGFGSSDCRCRTHLFYSSARQSTTLIENLQPAVSPSIIIARLTPKIWTGWMES